MTTRLPALPAVALLLSIAGAPNAQNSVQNGSFAGSIAGWPATDPRVTLVYSGVNGVGPPSGSLQVGNDSFGNKFAASGQCQNGVTGGQLYELAHQIRFFPQPHPLLTGTCRIRLVWASGTNCQPLETVLDLQGITNLFGPSVHWSQFSDVIMAPEFALSALIELRSGSIDTFPGAPPVTCHFDEIVFGRYGTVAANLYSDGFEPP